MPATSISDAGPGHAPRPTSPLRLEHRRIKNRIQVHRPPKQKDPQHGGKHELHNGGKQPPLQ